MWDHIARVLNRFYREVDPGAQRKVAEIMVLVRSAGISLRRVKKVLRQKYGRAPSFLQFTNENADVADDTAEAPQASGESDVVVTKKQVQADKKARAHEALAEVARKIEQLVVNFAASGTTSALKTLEEIGSAAGSGVLNSRAQPTELSILYRDANASRTASSSSANRLGEEGPVLSAPLTVEGAIYRFFENVAPSDINTVPMIVELVGGSEERLDACLDQLERRYGMRPVVDVGLRAAMGSSQKATASGESGNATTLRGSGASAGGTGPTLASALRLYFQTHAPKDLGSVPMILELIGDSPDRFRAAMRRLAEQYGVEPDISDNFMRHADDGTVAAAGNAQLAADLIRDREREAQEAAAAAMAAEAAKAAAAEADAARVAASNAAAQERAADQQLQLLLPQYEKRTAEASLYAFFAVQAPHELGGIPELLDLCGSSEASLRSVWRMLENRFGVAPELNSTIIASVTGAANGKNPTRSPSRSSRRRRRDRHQGAPQSGSNSGSGSDSSSNSYGTYSTYGSGSSSSSSAGSSVDGSTFSTFTGGRPDRCDS